MGNQKIRKKIFLFPTLLNFFCNFNSHYILMFLHFKMKIIDMFFLQSLDITKHKLIYEGPMMWRINKQKFNLHVVLMEEIILLLQKQDERFVLKFYNSMASGERPHSPIVKVCTALVRRNAAGKLFTFFVQKLFWNWKAH